MSNTNKKVSQAYTSADFFCRAGGVSCGMKMAEYNIVFALDFDPKALRTYDRNFPGICREEDIMTFDACEMLAATGLKPGALDLCHFSPECDKFSMCGTRDSFNPDNDQYFKCIEIAGILQPKVFTVETVDGITKGTDAKMFLSEFLRRLESLDMYKYSYKVMNAMYYGVPQSRRRFILIAVRKDIEILPAFPQPGNDLITVRDILPDVDYFSPGQYQNHLIPSDRPCCTLLGGNCLELYRNGKKCKPKLKELRLLAKFPDWFEFACRENENCSYVGDCVPPEFYKAIATTIRIEILDRHYGV